MSFTTNCIFFSFKFCIHTNWPSLLSSDQRRLSSDDLCCISFKEMESFQTDLPPVWCSKRLENDDLCLSFCCCHLSCDQRGWQVTIYIMFLHYRRLSSNHRGWQVMTFVVFLFYCHLFSVQRGWQVTIYIMFLYYRRLSKITGDGKWWPLLCLFATTTINLY